MSKGAVKDIAKSIRSRLLAYAKLNNENFNAVLIQYVLQRLLYRLSISEYAERFLLKGAWLFVVWNNALHRPTKDADLLGFGSNDENELLQVFKSIAQVLVDQPDGLIFFLDSFKSVHITEEGNYQGVRVTGLAQLDSANISFQVDIGFGDAVTPAALQASLPCLLDLPEPQLRVYPVYTVIAEKFQAMIFLGLVNSRMKDFFDIYTIALSMPIKGRELQAAIAATFDRRETAINEIPLRLFSDEFKHDVNKAKQWQGFINKNNIDCDFSFADVIERLHAFLQPNYDAIINKNNKTISWDAKTWQWMEADV